MMLEIKQIFKTLDLYSEPTVVGHQESLFILCNILTSSY